MSSPRLENKRDSALVQLTLVRFREFLREPEALFWVFGFPIILAAGLGVAFRNRPPEVIKIGAVSAELKSALAKEKLLDVTEFSDKDAAQQALLTGKIALLIESGAGGQVVYHYDDTSPDARTARMLADDAIQRASGRADPVASSEKLIREPGSRYIDFLLPGLLGMNLMGSGIWGLVFAIVDARRKKLMKRLIATPMPRHDYLLSFLLSRLGLLVMEVGLVAGFGALVFQVPMRGSLLSLVLICTLGSLSFSAIGLLISSRLQTIEAASGFSNLVMMPMWVVSGVFFSAQRFPSSVQPLIHVLPLTALIDALRANMLQGEPIAHLGQQLGVLGVWLVVSFALALKLFRWR